jgi:hypothetical protein
MNAPMIGTLNISVVIRGAVPADQAREVASGFGIGLALALRKSISRHQREAKAWGIDDETPLVGELNLIVNLGGAS